MNHLLAIIGSLSWRSLLGGTTGEVMGVYLLVLFFKISAIVVLALRVFRMLQERARKEASRLCPTPVAAPAEIAALVTELARRGLEIGSDQLDESMEKLRIPRGDFQRFLDDLEVDHGLSVPASARAMSTSISGVIAALCRGR
jgi:hypothetical protein